jgi:diaminopimelate decarboxylase
LPGHELCVRINPGLGSGGTKRTNVGGPGSSFGIWHEDIDQVKAIAQQHDLTIVKIHTHIGSGSDPEVWQHVAGMSLSLLDTFTDVHTLNLGGGFKVGRMLGEVSTDLQSVGAPVKEAFEAYAQKAGREIRLEIEPGTYMVGNAASLITRVATTTSTGSEGYLFYKLNAGMTEVMRPSLYGAQHPLIVVPVETDERKVVEVIVAGHCCESGDIFTPEDGDPEGLKPRALLSAKPGDWLVVEGVGAYCAGMSAKNYNSFPEAPEVLLRENGDIVIIRNRQSLDQILTNEVIV